MATDESGVDAMNKLTLKIVVILAVSLILFLSGSGYVLFRLGYFQAGNEYIGILTKKAYYFEAPRDGIYSYHPGKEPEKRISSFWVEDWDVNETALYYKYGRSLHSLDTENGRKRKLYEATDSRCSHISFSLREDGDILVNLYDKDEETVKKILVDGQDGEILCNLTGYVSYSDTELYDDSVDVRLDEQSFLPEGASYVLGYGDTITDVQPYIFYLSDYAIWCLDRETGEAWKMQESDSERIQSACTDGEYFYAISIAKSPSVYQIIKNQDGRPVGLQLIDEEIMKK